MSALEQGLLELQNAEVRFFVDSWVHANMQRQWAYGERRMEESRIGQS